MTEESSVSSETSQPYVRPYAGRRPETVICRAPWRGPVYLCEIHDSPWPTGAHRCNEADRRLTTTHRGYLRETPR